MHEHRYLINLKAGNEVRLQLTMKRTSHIVKFTKQRNTINIIYLQESYNFTYPYTLTILVKKYCSIVKFTLLILEYTSR